MGVNAFLNGPMRLAQHIAERAAGVAGQLHIATAANRMPVPGALDVDGALPIPDTRARADELLRVEHRLDREIELL